jgi:hypothetical protein
MMESLPDELLLSITSHVSSKDLLTVALVSRKLLPISQELLYRSLSISATSSSFAPNSRTPSNRFISILGTIHARPDLANLVRQLEIEPQHQPLPLGWVAQLPAEDEREPDQVGKPKSSSITECTIVESILERLDNLEALSILVIADDQAWRNKHDRQRYRISERMVEDMFGQESKKTAQLKDTTAHVKALRPVKELRLDGCWFELWWCSLPSLSTLRLGRFYVVRDSQIPASTTSRVHAMELEVSVVDFDEDPSSGSRIAREALGCFSALRKLSLDVCNTSAFADAGIIFDIVNIAVAMGSVDIGTFVATRLLGAASTLAEIEVAYQTDDFDEPTPSTWKIKPARFGAVRAQPIPINSHRDSNNLASPTSTVARQDLDSLRTARRSKDSFPRSTQDSALFSYER